jgi:2,5-furandicarboxylate decarboxylase 1
MGMERLKDIGAIIGDLDAMGRLVRIKTEVDINLDLAGIAAEFERGPRAVLFENVKGQKAPVLIGLYWSRELLGALMRTPERDLPALISKHIKKWQIDPVAPVVLADGPVREVTEKKVDVTKLPIPIHATKDGGAYFDAAMVITKDQAYATRPSSGFRSSTRTRWRSISIPAVILNCTSKRHGKRVNTSRLP